MKRKIALILATVICQSAINASAYIDEPIYDMFSNQVKITGKTISEKEGRPISVKILNPDQTLQYANTGFSGVNGVYEFNIKLHMDTVNDYGGYKILVSGYDYTAAEEKTIYVANDTEIGSVVENFNQMTENELVTNVLDYAKKLHLNFTLFTQVDTTELVRIIKQEANLKPFSAADMKDVHNRLKKCAIITAYNKGNQSLITSGATLLYDDILGLDNIDQNGITLYSVYKTRLSDAGKTNLISSMLNKGFNTYADWEKEFLKHIVLKTINYPSVGGVAYVAEVVTAQNAAKVNLAATQYLALSDKSTINSAVARKTYSTLDALEEALVPPTGSGNSFGSGSGSGTGSGSGFSIVGGYVPPVKSDEEGMKNEPSLEMTAFADIPADYWLFDELYDLKELEIISGDTDGNFRPNDYIKREEFLKILCEALKIPSKSSNNEFSDVEKNAWYENYIHTAFENGIVNGLEGNVFGVGRYISRQDLCVMVYRALKAYEEDIERPLFGFVDNESIADYAKNAIDYLYMSGTISGFEDDTFRPNENCTRAHAAKIIYSIMQKLKAKETE